MYRLKIRNEIASIESQKTGFCDSLNEGTEATLFFGSTGGGKTALIEFLLGKSLTINLRFGNPYLDSTSTNIGNGPDSKTREIITHISDANQLYIDTPGFHDTDGEYAEIKNHYAIENILQCKKIKGFKIGLVMAKSILFYEALRNKDFISFVKSIKNFLPKLGSTDRMNEAFIVITKTEKRTTTNDVIKAWSSVIKENNFDSREQAFFENIIDNRKIALFPLPEEPYIDGDIYHNPKSHESILQLIKHSAYIPLEIQDFKKFNLSLALDGEVVKDINMAKIKVSTQIDQLISAIKNYQQEVLIALPTRLLLTSDYERQKKVLKDYSTNFEKFCTSPANHYKIPPNQLFYIQAMSHFHETPELINDLCELDYSIKFMKKFTGFDETLININDLKDQISNMLHEIIVANNWKICITNSYKTLFQSFKNDPHTQKKSIDTLLKNNAAARDLFENNWDQKIVLSKLTNQCSLSEKDGKEILELASLNEDNVLRKLAKFITQNQELQYHRCKITGSEPNISQISFENENLNECEEIAIYGRFGIKIDKSLETELRGKNLVMIAPIIKVIGEQKIILSGKDAQEHSILQANDGQDGQAGNIGESSGSFFAYSYNAGNTLTILADGGKGSAGQDGGKGENGKKGEPDDGSMLQSSYNDVTYSKKFLHEKPEGITYNWYQVNKYSDNGEPGTQGSNGLTGGEGGKGGVMGKVDFITLVPEEVSFTSSTLDGLDGRNGAPGKGGEGGQHGDATEGIWHYPECTTIFSFVCRLWSPEGYWELNHEPTPQISQKAPALNGETGSNIPFHKSSDPIYKPEIFKEKHKEEYVKFILEEENNSFFEFYQDNTSETCINSVDNQYSCF